MTESLPEGLRASDAERDQAVEALRNAVADGRLGVDELDDRVQSAYTVRTRSELERLIADISPHPLGHRHPGTPEGAVPVVREGPGGSRWIVSIMGGHERKGHWRVGRRCTVVNVMGGSDLDLNEAELSAQETVITVFSLMGGSEIHVPEGAEVDVSKFALMGGNDADLGESVAPAGAPVIRVRLLSLMGGTSVRRGRKLTRAERKEQKRLREAKARGELEP